VEDQERLEFIKKRISYLTIKTARSSGKTQFIKDLLWLVEKAEEGILKNGK
jgi:hypothetical protein